MTYSKIVDMSLMRKLSANGIIVAYSEKLSRGAKLSSWQRPDKRAGFVTL